MLYIRIELWPGGDHHRAEILHEGKIWNDGTGDDETASYGFWFSPRKAPRETLAWGKLEKFKRAEGAWALLYRCLQKAVRKIRA